VDVVRHTVPDNVHHVHLVYLVTRFTYSSSVNRSRLFSESNQPNQNNFMGFIVQLQSSRFLMRISHFEKSHLKAVIQDCSHNRDTNSIRK